MAITKRPPKKSADEFISAAPDAAPAAPAAKAADEVIRRVMLGRQAQISLAMPPDLLARVDDAAKKLSISRAAFIKLALTRAVVGEGG